MLLTLYKQAYHVYARYSLSGISTILSTVDSFLELGMLYLRTAKQTIRSAILTEGNTPSSSGRQTKWGIMLVLVGCT